MGIFKSIANAARRANAKVDAEYREISSRKGDPNKRCPQNCIFFDNLSDSCQCKGNSFISCNLSRSMTCSDFINKFRN